MDPQKLMAAIARPMGGWNADQRTIFQG